MEENLDSYQDQQNKLLGGMGGEKIASSNSNAVYVYVLAS